MENKNINCIECKEEVDLQYILPNKLCYKCDKKKRASQNKNGLATKSLNEDSLDVLTNKNIEVKNISYLNSKTWYRLLKVTFIAFFLCIFGILNTFAFSENMKKIDQNKTTIRCEQKDKKTFSLESAGIFLDESILVNGKFDYKTFYKSYNDYKIKDILKECYADSGVKIFDDIFDQQKSLELVNSYGLIGKEKSDNEIKLLEKDFQSYLQKTKYVYGDEKAKFLDFKINFFDIIPEFTYDRFYKLFFGGNLIILVIFEVLRRVSYYITLGTLKPKK